MPYGDDLVNWQYVEEIGAVLASLLPDARLSWTQSLGSCWRVETAALRDEFGAAAPVPAAEGFAKTIANAESMEGSWQVVIGIVVVRPLTGYRRDYTGRRDSLAWR